MARVNLLDGKEELGMITLDEVYEREELLKEYWRFSRILESTL